MSPERPHPVPEEQYVPAEPGTSVERLAEAHKEDIERIERLKLGEQQIAQIIWVLLGEQPAMDIWVHPIESPETVMQILQKAGLSVIRTETADKRGRTHLILYAARTPALADQLMQTAPPPGEFRTEHETYARLMGFPQTAIDAFLGRTPRLPEKEQDALHEDPDILIGMKLSKDHWKEELDFLHKRAMIIKRYTPALYEGIVRGNKGD